MSRVNVVHVVVRCPWAAQGGNGSTPFVGVLDVVEVTPSRAKHTDMLAVVGGQSFSQDCGASRCLTFQFVSFNVAENGNSFTPTPSNPLFLDRGHFKVEGAYIVHCFSRFPCVAVTKHGVHGAALGCVVCRHVGQYPAAPATAVVVCLVCDILIMCGPRLCSLLQAIDVRWFFVDDNPMAAIPTVSAGHNGWTVTFFSLDRVRPLTACQLARVCMLRDPCTLHSTFVCVTRCVCAALADLA